MKLPMYAATTALIAVGLMLLDVPVATTITQFILSSFGIACILFAGMMLRYDIREE